MTKAMILFVVEIQIACCDAELSILSLPLRHDFTRKSDAIVQNTLFSQTVSTCAVL